MYQHWLIYNIMKITCNFIENDYNFEIDTIEYLDIHQINEQT